MLFSQYPPHLELVPTLNSDISLRKLMKVHYSQPGGFLGRNICYGIYYNGQYYGHIVGGSATRYLPGRNEFFNIDGTSLNNIINNVFFHIQPINNKYPVRNFSTVVVSQFTLKAQNDWKYKYKDNVIGFETLVEPPRTGELYKRAGWIYVGITKGETCKRIVGHDPTESRFGGIRIWDRINLRPKLVFCLDVRI